LQYIDILIIGIEASIALAGFAGLVASYQITDIAKIRRSNVTALNVIVLYSLLSGLSCAIALVLYAFGFADELWWTLNSIIMAALFVVSMTIISIRMKSVVGSKKAWYLYLALQGIGCLFPLALVLNAVGLVFHQEPGPFFAALTYALSTSGYMFYRLILRPLWRLVSLREVDGQK